MGDWGGLGFWGGGSLEKEGGKGVLVMDFYVLLSIGWGFLSWFVFLSFSFSFFSGGEVCIFVFLFLLFALFFLSLFSISASSLFLTKTTSD